MQRLPTTVRELIDIDIAGLKHREKFKAVVQEIDLLELQIQDVYVNDPYHERRNICGSSTCVSQNGIIRGFYLDGFINVGTLQRLRNYRGWTRTEYNIWCNSCGEKSYLPLKCPDRISNPYFHVLTNRTRKNLT